MYRRKQHQEVKSSWELDQFFDLIRRDDSGQRSTDEPGMGKPQSHAHPSGNGSLFQGGASSTHYQLRPGDISYKLHECYADATRSVDASRRCCWFSSGLPTVYRPDARGL